MNTDKQIPVSVIIINYNGAPFLERCFSSLFKTRYDNFEVIFVDNASTDTSIALITQHYKDGLITIVLNNQNYGVPLARNIGFLKARGEIVIFLDNDTEVHPDWISKTIEVFSRDPQIAVAQSKLLNMAERKKFDHAGDYITPFGILFERSNQSIDRGQFDHVDDIFNAKGAAFAVRSLLFKNLGMFDDTYFMYLEETDFCCRVWLAGYRVVFVPDSIVWHAFNTPLKQKVQFYSSKIVRFYGCRNYIATLLKNFSVPTLITMLPLQLASWLVLAASFLIQGKTKDCAWILEGIAWNVFNLNQIRRKRSFVQKNIRKIRDRDFLEKAMIKKPFEFYLRKARCYLEGKPFEGKTN